MSTDKLISSVYPNKFTGEYEFKTLAEWEAHYRKEFLSEIEADKALQELAQDDDDEEDEFSMIDYGEIDESPEAMQAYVSQQMERLLNPKATIEADTKAREMLDKTVSDVMSGKRVLGFAVDQVQLEPDPNAPKYEQGMILGFMQDLEGTELKHFLDELRHCLALQVAYQVMGNKKDLKKLLNKEVSILKLIAQEEITNPTPPAD